jgi:hypothetical protein
MMILRLDKSAMQEHNPQQNDNAQQLAESLMPAMSLLNSCSTTEEARRAIIEQAYLEESDEDLIPEFNEFRACFNRLEDKGSCTRLLTVDLQDALFIAGLTDRLPNPNTDWQQPRPLSAQEQFVERYITSIDPEIFQKFKDGGPSTFLEFNKQIYLAVMTESELPEQNYGIAKFMSDEIEKNTPLNWLFFGTKETHLLFTKQFLAQMVTDNLSPFERLVECLKADFNALDPTKKPD